MRSRRHSADLAQSDPDRPYAPGSETWNQYLARAGAALSGLIRRHDGQRILIAGHGETVDAAATLLLGLSPWLLDASRLRIRSRIDHPLEHAAQPVRPGSMDTRRPERHPAPGQRTVTRSAVLLEAAKRLLGSCEVTAVLGDAVLRVRDARSQEFVVKQHGTRSKHDREVHAYRHWTAALGPSAPRLIAADSEAMTIVITTSRHPSAASSAPPSTPSVPRTATRWPASSPPASSRPAPSRTPAATRSD